MILRFKINSDVIYSQILFTWIFFFKCTWIMRSYINNFIFFYFYRMKMKLWKKQDKKKIFKYVRLYRIRFVNFRQKIFLLNFHCFFFLAVILLSTIYLTLFWKTFSSVSIKARVILFKWIFLNHSFKQNCLI